MRGFCSGFVRTNTTSDTVLTQLIPLVVFQRNQLRLTQQNRLLRRPNPVMPTEGTYVVHDGRVRDDTTFVGDGLGRELEVASDHEHADGGAVQDTHDLWDYDVRDDRQGSSERNW